MLILELFLTFLMIGAVSFGGGYGMLSLIKEQVVSHGWLTEGELLNFIAVSESTPGPIAVNIATFVGSSQAGIIGSIVCTIGVILPAFIIMLVISALLKNLLKYKGVDAFLKGIRPAVIALIVGTGVTLIISRLFNISTINDEFIIDIKGVIIFAIICVIYLIYKKIKKKNISPIILIVVSAALGMLMYSIFD